MNEVAELLRLTGLLLFILAGLAFIFQARRAGGRLLFIGFIAVVLSGVLPSLDQNWVDSVMNRLGALPLWVTIIVGGLLVIAALQGFVRLFLGRQAANSFAGNLAATLFRGVFAVILAPFRLLARFFGNSI